MEIVRENRFIRLLRLCVKLLILLLSFFMFLTSLTIVGLLYLRSQPLPAHQIQETTTIYAVDGQVLDMIHQGQNRTYVPIEQMPISLIQAAIAVEDQRFFEHFGLDLRRILGVILINLREGGKVEGGSTITQQLARNLYLSHEKTWERKIKEAIYALQLEMHYSKTEILEKYLNQIYFGHSAYGVEAASQLFFDKHVGELTLAESALLIGIPKGPRYYSPWLDFERAKKRQELILRLMHQQGYITEEEYQAALEEKLTITEPEKKGAERASSAPYFRDYIRHYVTQKYQIPEDVFEHGGLRIYTTLDPEMQRMAEKAISESLPEDRPLQAALLAIEPSTGYIRAMVGGRDYATSQYNRVFASRQPGSAIKPFLYYAALEQGFTPLTLLKSEPTTFVYDEGRATYTPRNFNDSYSYDFITLERAIAQSDNIYAVKTLMFLGEEMLVDTLHRFGIERDFQPLPSLALGAQNVSLYELVKGYGVLANQGIRMEPTPILRIEDREGRLIVQEKPKGEAVLDEDITFILNRLLQSVFEPGGTAHRVAHLIHRPVHGKTGSTDTDAWMVGFTPQLVAGVWVGYDQNQFINHNNDGRLAAQIWAKFLEESLKDELPALYAIPAGVTGVYIDSENGLLASESCPVKRLLYFKKGTEPTEYCREHLPSEQAAPLPPVKETPSMWQRMKEWLTN